MNSLVACRHEALWHNCRLLLPTLPGKTMDFFISTAHAQAAGAAGQPSALMSFAPLVLIFVVFYFHHFLVELNGGEDKIKIN